MLALPVVCLVELGDAKRVLAFLGPPSAKKRPMSSIISDSPPYEKTCEESLSPQENMSTIGQMLKHKIKTNVFKRAFKHVCVWVLCISTCFLVEILP